MELNPHIVHVKNSKVYLPISLSFFLSSVGECRYSCSNRRYLPTLAQLLSRYIGAVISGCAAALIYTSMKFFGTVVPMLLIHGLSAFAVFLSMLTLSISQWLPLHFLPWRVQEKSAFNASDKKERILYLLLPLLCFLASAGTLGFLL